MPARPDYQERLHAPLRWWVQATMLVASLWLALVVALPGWVAWAATVVVAATAYGFLAWLGWARVGVHDGVLQAGRARIPVELTGPAEVLDRDATRRVHGVDADARAYLLTRPYLKRAVRVPIEDPADPTPYWLVGTRRPERLAEALRAQRRAP